MNLDLDPEPDDPRFASILVVDEQEGRTRPLAELLDAFQRDGEIWGTRDRVPGGEAVDYVGPAKRIRLYRVVDWGPEKERGANSMLSRREEITAGAFTPVRRIDPYDG